MSLIGKVTFITGNFNKTIQYHSNFNGFVKPIILQKCHIQLFTWWIIIIMLIENKHNNIMASGCLESTRNGSHKA